MFRLKQVDPSKPRDIEQAWRVPYWTHARVSYLKSAVRIVACLSGVWSFAAFCIGFAVAELLGVWEEWGSRGN